MTIRLRVYGDPILGQVCKKVEEFGEVTKTLRTDMVEAMNRFGGIGLAANQAGLDMSMFIAKIGGEDRAFFNPVVLETNGALRSREGCLSLPGIVDELPRYETIKLAFQDEEGYNKEETFEGRDAIVVQHELHHLLGKLFSDFLSKTKQDIIKRKMAKFPRKVVKSYVRSYLASKAKR